MFSALLYLQYHTVRNRLVSRIKRLKQPKYLIGAIVGGFVFRQFGAAGVTGLNLPSMVVAVVGAVIVLVVYHWVFGRRAR